MNATIFDIDRTSGGATYASLDGTTDYKSAPHRVRLWRRWPLLIADKPHPLMVVCLNPSTADHEVNDPTIRRIINHAKREGHPGIDMFNLFSLRSPCPKVMMASDYPSVPQNLLMITEFAMKATHILCGWGNHGSHKGEGESILNVLREWSDAKIYCLGKNKNGSPKHPLYLRDDAAIEIL